MLKAIVWVCTLLIPLSNAAAQNQANKEGVPVEVVATASEYVPRSTTISHVGHSYTNCVGSTDYFARFHDYGDAGSVSGTANTTTNCKTTFSPPSETTLTTYLKLNYTIAKGEQALYLLSRTQRWKPTRKERVLAGIAGIAAAGGGESAKTNSDEIEQKFVGTWTTCPAFVIGSKYTLTVRNTSDARLEDTTGGKANKLEYLSSATVPPTQSKPTAPPQTQATDVPPTAKVHITSSPSGGEIYIDGKFMGNTPSDITLAAGEHSVKITIGDKEWSRSVQVTAGEIRVHADMAEK